MILVLVIVMISILLFLIYKKEPFENLKEKSSSEEIATLKKNKDRTIFMNYLPALIEKINNYRRQLQIQPSMTIIEEIKKELKLTLDETLYFSSNDIIFGMV